MADLLRLDWITEQYITFLQLPLSVINWTKRHFTAMICEFRVIQFFIISTAFALRDLKKFF